ncbi:hypothetical protein BDA96_07G202600 [Sorghum bicolor]|uniref:Uncharacterized protein n=2 Tax=Sorghum bicolor TaxID=4558 RepID=A0A921QPH5_SORBI|nr:hypothetical protein BDA96_07G202600 [Sorghum bicolor]OQU80815.1 hypothetical protein SORBI_3007G190466 [Sorghum bicolor]
MCLTPDRVLETTGHTTAQDRIMSVIKTDARSMTADYCSCRCLLVPLHGRVWLLMNQHRVPCRSGRSALPSILLGSQIFSSDR